MQTSPAGAPDAVLLIASGAGQPGAAAACRQIGNLARFHTAGDHRASWRCRLEAMGMHCLPLPRGLSTFVPIIELWLDRLVSARRSTVGEGHA